MGVNNKIRTLGRGAVLPKVLSGKRPNRVMVLHLGYSLFAQCHCNLLRTNKVATVKVMRAMTAMGQAWVKMS